jgi:hypothetical protein
MLCKSVSAPFVSLSGGGLVSKRFSTDIDLCRILLAIELNGPLRYFNSANFTIVEQEIIQTSSSPKSHIVG